MSSSTDIEAMERELKILQFLENIKALSVSDIPSLTAEDIFSLCQEVAMIATQYFSQPSWRSHRQINPDIIVGETDTSSDKTIAGTVSSRKVFRHPVVYHSQNDAIVNYFHCLYSQSAKMKEVVRNKNFFLDIELQSFKPGHNSSRRPRTSKSHTRDETLRTDKNLRKIIQEVINISQEGKNIALKPNPIKRNKREMKIAANRVKRSRERALKRERNRRSKLSK